MTVVRCGRAAARLSSLATAVTVFASGPAGAGHGPGMALNLPSRFEANAGRYPSEVRYVARGSRSSLFVTCDSVVIALPRSSIAIRAIGGKGRSVTGEGLLPGATNHLVGRREDWRTGMAGYGSVRSADLYPGIDVRYYSARGEMECDYVVAPGADPRSILLEVSAPGPVRVSGGDLVVGTADGDVRWRRPVSYQVISGRRRPVTSSYRVTRARGGKATRVAFDLGPYDARRPLVIDPAFQYVTHIGGFQSDTVYGVTNDAAGNIFVVGEANSPDYPTTAGAYRAANQGNYDVVVTKMNPSGSAMVYSTFIGGSQLDSGSMIDVDASGNAYIAGYTTSNNYPTTPGVVQASYGGGTFDAVLTKLNATGSAIVYSTYIGGNKADKAHDVAVDGAGQAVVVGETASSGFPTLGGYAYSGNIDAFVTQVNASCTSRLISRCIGGAADDWANGCRYDIGGNVELVGVTASANFPVTPGALQPLPGGGTDAFVSKVSAGTGAIAACTYLGGATDDVANSLAATPMGNVFVCGQTFSTNFPVSPTAYQATRIGLSAGFVTKINQTLTGILYSTYLGGLRNTYCTAVAMNSNASRVFVVGSTDSIDFPVTSDAYQKVNAGNTDGIIVEMDGTLDHVLYATYMGGSNDDQFTDVTMSTDGIVYLSGDTHSTDFPVTANAYQPTNLGNRNGIVATFRYNTGPSADAQSVSATEDIAKAITLTGSDPDGNPITYAIATQPLHGTLTGSGSSWTYTPDADYNGPDSFTFTASDDVTTSAPATVSITVGAVNDAPTATPQTVGVTEDIAKAITLAGTDPDGNPLTYTVLTQPTHGALTGSGSSWTYTPSAEYSGSDSFTFKVNDGTVDSVPATVTLNVAAVNDPPTVGTNSYTVDADGTLTVTSPGVLAGASDPDGPSALIARSASTPAHGAVTLNADGSFTYTPSSPTYKGTDSFTYEAYDGSAATTGTANITIRGLTAITAGAAAGTVLQPISLTATLTWNGTPIAGVTVKFTTPDGQTLTGTTNASGLATASYTPPSGTYGALTYTATFEGNSEYMPISDTGDVTISRVGTQIIADTAASWLVGNMCYVPTTTTTTIGQAVPNGTVRYTLPDASTFDDVTNIDGIAELYWDVPARQRTCTIYARFQGDGVHAPCETSIVVSLPITTHISVVGGKAYAGNRCSLVAYLWEGAALYGIPGKTLTYSLGGTTIGSAPTVGTYGKAALTYTVPAATAAGNHTLTVSFAGDTDWPATTNTGTLQVLAAKKNTYVWVHSHGAARNVPTKLTCYLYDYRPNGDLLPMASKPIEFRIATTTVAAVSTGADGKAWVAYIPSSAGALTQTMSYAGDDEYNPATNTGTLTVAP